MSTIRFHIAVQSSSVLSAMLFIYSCTVDVPVDSNFNPADSGGSVMTATAGDTAGTQGGVLTGGSTSTGGILTGGALAGGTLIGGALTGGSASTGGMLTGGSLSTGGSTSTGGSMSTGGSDASGMCAGPVSGTMGHNPLFTNIFTADPAALVYNCTFYITAGHDQGTTGFDLRDWYVLSSTDMVNWSDNGGPIMGLSTFAWANANAWAGQMVKRDGTFYWYVPVNESGGGMAIGVAVSDNPLGPFTDALGKPLVNDAFEMAMFGYSDPGQTVYTIDPTVFIDDDGQAYLLYGGTT